MKYVKNHLKYKKESQIFFQVQNSLNKEILLRQIKVNKQKINKMILNS